LQDWKLTDNQKFGGGHCKTGNWWTRSQGWTLQDSSPAMTDKGGAENLWLAGLGGPRLGGMGDFRPPVGSKGEAPVEGLGDFVPQKLKHFLKNRYQFFTALHVMQTRYSDENSVCLSVCPSVCLSHACIVTKRKKNLSRFLYYTKYNLAKFTEKNGLWGATPST